MEDKNKKSFLAVLSEEDKKRHADWWKRNGEHFTNFCFPTYKYQKTNKADINIRLTFSFLVFVILILLVFLIKVHFS